MFFYCFFLRVHVTIPLILDFSLAFFLCFSYHFLITRRKGQSNDHGGSHSLVLLNLSKRIQQ
jgi:hypothetical protein